MCFSTFLLHFSQFLTNVALKLIVKFNSASNEPKSYQFGVLFRKLIFGGNSNVDFIYGGKITLTFVSYFVICYYQLWRQDLGYTTLNFSQFDQTQLDLLNI